MKTGNGLRQIGLGLHRHGGFFSLWVMVLLIVVVAVAVVVCLSAIRQRDAYKKELQLRDRDFAVRVNAEKHRIVEDLEEKYRADRISYEVMSRRIEMSKNQLRAIESRSR